MECRAALPTLEAEYLSKSDIPHLKGLGEYIKKNKWYYTSYTNQSVPKHAAMLGSPFLFRLVFGSPQTYFYSKDAFGYFPFGVAIRRDFCCKKRFNTVLLRILSGGLYNKFMSDVFFKLDLKKNLNNDFYHSTAASALGLPDLNGVFIVLGVGFAAAVSALILEIMFSRWLCSEPLQTLSLKTVLDDSNTYLIKDTLTVGLHFFISTEPSLLAIVPVECNARSKLIWTEYSILLPLNIPEINNNSEYHVTSPFASTSTEHPEFQIELHCYVGNDNKNPVAIIIHMAKLDFEGFLQCKLSFLNKEVVKYMCKTNCTFEPEMDDPLWRIDISKETYCKYSIEDSLCLKCELLVSTGKFTSILEKTVYKREISDDSISKGFNMSYLQSNLLEMYENKILCDFKVLVSGREFSVHKTILYAVSPVFRAMFESGMTEAEKSQVKIEEFSVEAVEKMLDLSYSSRVTGLEWNASLELYSIADKYQIQKLKTICSSFLESSLSVERVPDLLVLANLHEDTHLSEVAENFICGNSKAVFQSTAWENFMKVNAPVASETMYRICKLFSEININPLD